MSTELVLCICFLISTLNSAHGKILGTYNRDTAGFIGNELGYHDEKQVNRNSLYNPVKSQNTFKAGAFYRDLLKPFNESSISSKLRDIRRNNVSQSSNVDSVERRDSSTFFKTKAKKMILVPLQVVNGKRKVVGKIKEFFEPNAEKQYANEMDNSHLLNKLKPKKGFKKVLSKGNLNPKKLKEKTKTFTFKQEDLDLKPIDKSSVYLAPLYVEVYSNQNDELNDKDKVDAIIKSNIDAILAEPVKNHKLPHTLVINVGKEEDDLRNSKYVHNNVNHLKDMLTTSDEQTASNATLIRQKRVRRQNIRI